jgi:hypothetical protein
MCVNLTLYVIILWEVIHVHVEKDFMRKTNFVKVS